MIGLGRRTDTIDTFTDLISEQETWLVDHGARVARIAATLGTRLGLGTEQLRRLHVTAHLHDVGKIHIDSHVVNKPGPLADQEWEEMRRHPAEGFLLLEGLVHPEIATAVLFHHERFDGGGYPRGLSGTAIPYLSRILFVADAFDAITSERPYQAALSTEIALGEIELHAGSQFDPAVVAAMLMRPSGAHHLSRSQTERSSGLPRALR
ncbi:MAG: HD domain-containing protein [Gammaproteobacteria bacterium]|nr:HD domain-containing protein [Gammaproteobacteria bacterium]